MVVNLRMYVQEMFGCLFWASSQQLLQNHRHVPGRASSHCSSRARALVCFCVQQSTSPSTEQPPVSGNYGHTPSRRCDYHLFHRQRRPRLSAMSRV
jgi:hypothetical protein